ncbi:inositol phosphorylceramide synthase [Actinoplanes sp. ATCC 53533]|uniref:phosphatase PAP2 family protein n=1 Tax=Actinoplanes sp. ATCC 53533 TaxID=1288362 RepID=UPI000F79BD51|nr:phosphatase PAP2 family protein [Actinoplanes sp. ATCC 53533]RSM42185.1 inositol phosphorylceramide synthase [Actinoplanes sp. ATCC 53533]
MLQAPPETTTVPAPGALAKRRILGILIWATAFGIFVGFVGVPSSDPMAVFGWLWLATIAWRNHLPWKQHLLFLRDWLPIVLLLMVYNVSRGYADGLREPYVTPLIEADKAMFGWLTGGQVPTTWLQQHLYDGTTPWWMAVVTVVYVSHFFVVPTIAVVLWLRTRPLWARFVRRWFTLCLAGLITYFVYPAAPPWWASDKGKLAEKVTLISDRGWDVIGLQGAGNTLNELRVDQSNPVAAMPSLHTAWALMAVVFFLPMVRKRWWPLLLTYPIAMTFTLVYTGEHYIIDVLVGWLYVGAVFLLVRLAERWWAARQRTLRSSVR